MQTIWKSFFLTFLRAALWVDPSHPFRVRILLKDRESWKASSYMLHNGKIPVLQSFIASLTAAARSTPYLAIQLIKTTGDWATGNKCCLEE